MTQEEALAAGEAWKKDGTLPSQTVEEIQHKYRNTWDNPFWSELDKATQDEVLASSGIPVPPPIKVDTKPHDMRLQGVCFWANACAMTPRILSRIRWEAWSYGFTAGTLFFSLMYLFTHFFLYWGWK